MAEFDNTPLGKRAIGKLWYSYHLSVHTLVYVNKCTPEVLPMMRQKPKSNHDHQECATPASRDSYTTIHKYTFSPEEKTSLCAIQNPQC
jgi:hypothetical protein